MIKAGLTVYVYVLEQCEPWSFRLKHKTGGRGEGESDSVALTDQVVLNEFVINDVMPQVITVQVFTAQK